MNGAREQGVEEMFLVESKQMHSQSLVIPCRGGQQTFPHTIFKYLPVDELWDGALSERAVEESEVMKIGEPFEEAIEL